MTLDEISGHFENVRRVGANLSARCPAHEDARNSLSLNNGDKAIVLHCQAGCETRDVLAKIGLTFADLYPTNGNGNGHGNFQTAATYPYRDQAGVLLYEAVRMEPKDFRFRRPDGAGGWIWKLDSTPRVLYRLPELLKADPAEMIWIVEGEKDVDRLRSIGLIGTTNPGGAGKWRPEFNDSLRGRRVGILPDNDAAGGKHAQQVAASLRGVATSVKVLQLPDLPDKGDVSDWLNNGGTAAALRELGEKAPEWKPRAEKAEKGRTHDTALPALAEFPRTDSGNAELFARLYGEMVRFDHQQKRFLVWAGHGWTPDADAEVRRLAKEAARHRYRLAAELEDADEKQAEAKWAISSESRQKLDATLSLTQAERPIADAGEGWDADPWLLGCPNGVIDLRTGKIRPGRPEDRITMSTGIPFNPEAPCPRWERFLAEVFNVDAELIDWVHRRLGYSTTGDVSEEDCLISHGPGSNGKTTFHESIRAALGDYATDTPFSTFEMNSRPSIPNDLAALVGRRFVTASESTEGSRLNEARIKALTGGDSITARFLNHEFFTFRPVLKLWLGVNHKPRVRDDSYGFWRRVRLLPFSRQFKGEAADKTLKASLRSEAPGILAWTVRGALAWQERGLEPPASVIAATEQYQAESDPLSEFIAERCVTREGCIARGRELYDAYDAWAKDRRLNDRERLGSTAFGTRMGERFEKKHDNQGTYYRGIGLAAGGEQELGL